MKKLLMQLVAMVVVLRGCLDSRADMQMLDPLTYCPVRVKTPGQSPFYILGMSPSSGIQTVQIDLGTHVLTQVNNPAWVVRRESSRQTLVQKWFDPNCNGCEYASFKQVFSYSATGYYGSPGYRTMLYANAYTNSPYFDGGWQPNTASFNPSTWGLSYEGRTITGLAGGKWTTLEKDTFSAFSLWTNASNAGQECFLRWQGNEWQYPLYFELVPNNWYNIQEMYVATGGMQYVTPPAWINFNVISLDFGTLIQCGF